MNEDFWKTVEAPPKYTHERRRTGALNLALLFGTAVIALSMIVTPMLAGKSNSIPRLATVPEDIDNLLTGSIKRTENGQSYTIRNSILPEHKNGPCIVEGYNSTVVCR